MDEVVTERTVDDDLGRLRSSVDQHLAASIAVLERAVAGPAFRNQLVKVSALCAATLRSGGKILLAGNGGRAGDARHIAGEFLSRLNFNRAPLAAVALATDTSVLTAVGNPYGFERQVRGLGLSTSCTFPNVLRALSAARGMSIATVGFGGEGETTMSPLCDLMVQAPSKVTLLIRQIHIVAAHAICSLVEQMLFRR